MPLRVNGFTSLDTLKVKLSVWSSQLTPRPRGEGKGSAPKSRSLKSLAHSSLLLAASALALVLVAAVLTDVRVEDLEYLREEETLDLLCS